MKEIEKIKSKKKNIISNSNQYKHLNKIKTYTIDEKNTVEKDDALSIEFSGDDKNLWIHIANPSELISINSDLEKYAYERSSTIYGHKDITYMLPRNLIEDCLSLETGRDSLALSLCITVDKDNSIKTYGFYKTVIKPSYALTYEEADEILDYQPKEEIELIEICNILKTFREYRYRNGAILIEEPEGIIYLDNNVYKLKIKELTPARKLVSEAMILYGSTIAQFCQEKKICIPYRNQPKGNKLQNSNSNDPIDRHIFNHQAKKCLFRSTIDISPKGHSSLGLKSYTQASSPLRRYIDYITQYQVISYLSNKELINKSLLGVKIEYYNKKMRNVINLSREDRKTAIVNYINSMDGTKWNCVFMQWLNFREHIGLLFFTKLAIDIECYISSTRDLKLGDRIVLNIKDIDIDKAFIKAII